MRNNNAPGSKTATDHGYTCPVMDNSHGKGNPLETGKNNEQTLHQSHA